VSLFGRDELRRLEGELREARRLLEEADRRLARLEAAVVSAPVGVVLVDGAGSVVVRNPAASPGGHVEAMIDSTAIRLAELSREGHPAAETIEVVGPPPRVLALRGGALDDGSVVVVVDDVTERTRLDAVRTDFVANISHELKTPVGALSLLAETIAGSTDLGEVESLAERMIDEADRAAHTIDDLLELSRIELATMDLEDVAVMAILEESAARHRLGAEAVGVTVSVTCGCPVEGVTVRGDRRQLVSAVSNLVDNAVKYTEPGGRVQLSCSEDGTDVEITVTDSGVGIPERDLERVFERFYRVDRARSRTTGGTGLGLAIVRHVAANHGGTVGVRSREGQGSVFSVRLPAGGR